MQSWGERARWSVRDTAPEPTKSGVIGLLGCALGVKDDTTLRDMSRALRMGVRCDQPGARIIDYHTVGGGYAQPALLTAEGKRKLSSGAPHTEQTWRYYLCGAAFLVALQGEPSLISTLADAVQSPHWPFFLGRKSCPPCRPPYDGTGNFEGLEMALREWGQGAGLSAVEVQPQAAVRAVIECAPDTPGAVRRRDEIGSRAHRTFEPRYTVDKRIIVTRDTEEAG